MNKEEYEAKQLIDELAKMPPMVIATAYLHALNYTRYGVDVTEDWVTATQNVNALEKAYIEGYHDASQKYAEQKIGYWDEDNCCSECGGDPMDFIDSMDAYIEKPMLYCPHCGAKMEGKVDILDYIHKPIKERLKGKR